MVAAFRSGFIAGFPVGKFSLGGQPEVGEEFQGAVNGRMADSGINFDDLSENLGEALVPRRVQEDVKNFFPLSGRLQPFFGNPSLKEVRFYKAP